MPDLYIIAGCNGAGKTTASFTILPEMLNCREFVNADEIARGLSPFEPESVGIEAGRIMLSRIDELIKQKKDFAFETTLSSKSFVNTIKKAKEEGYSVKLVFLWLNSEELAICRVKNRVEKGGHNIPKETIIRRYKSGIFNFINLYLPVCDYWILFDNSLGSIDKIAEGFSNTEKKIFEQDKWNIIYGQKD